MEKLEIEILFPVCMFVDNNNYAKAIMLQPYALLLVKVSKRFLFLFLRYS